MSELDAMIALAARCREQAYAPYSGFKVGACVSTPDGRLFGGCNVENIAFAESACAEANAIGAMIAAGERVVSALVVLAEGDALCTPCGGCRQRLAEFAGPRCAVHVCGPQGLRQTYTLAELLPAGFKFDQRKP